ncbi:MAG TPA: ATP-binding protein [Gemmatimonadaceae bacterium]
MKPTRLNWWHVTLAATTLVGVTLAMLLFRSRLDKAHVALVYLLVVLGGSAAEGRRVGFALGIASFISFNFLFLPPYYTLTIADPLDWIVLAAFLVTSLVAAELLARQRRQAELARQRSAELDRLSTLGAETLNAARAEQALAAIATVIQSAVGVDRCELFVRDGATLRAVGDTSDDVSIHAAIDAESLLGYVVKFGQSAVERDDSTLRVMPIDRPEEAHEPLPPIRALALPLAIRGEIVGALRLTSTNAFSLSEDQRRVLLALAYYAALGIERLRLESSEETAEALRRADRLKDSLLAAVSHDLRTPLTTIKGIAHEIVDGGDASRAGVIVEEADRLSTLVDGLLQLSQLDAGAVPLAIELNTMDDLIGASLRRAEGSLKHHRVEVELIDEELLVGRFDLAESLRIVVNLLDNAAKYSPVGSEIRVVARRRETRLVLTIADQGRGIAYGELEKIFHPFYRAPGSIADVRGAGLGLAIARRLAQAQGGSLTVESEPGRGSSFTLELIAADLPAL